MDTTSTLESNQKAKIIRALSRRLYIDSHLLFKVNVNKTANASFRAFTIFSKINCVTSAFYVMYAYTNEGIAELPIECLPSRNAHGEYTLNTDKSFFYLSNFSISPLKQKYRSTLYDSCSINFTFHVHIKFLTVKSNIV